MAPESGTGLRDAAYAWRRIRVWRALSGLDRKVIFRQEHPPGRFNDDNGSYRNHASDQPKRRTGVRTPKRLERDRAAATRPAKRAIIRPRKD